MPPPFRTPIGLQLSQAARTVGRAFDEALEAAGGTLPMWLVLLNLKIHRPANQRELAEAVGVREATLTHHLNAMDARGLITRTRDPENRRIHVVRLTEAGEQAFLRLREAAVGFDTRLRTGLTEAETDSLTGLLGRLVANVGGADDGAPPWAGFAEPAAKPGARRQAAGPAKTAAQSETPTGTQPEAESDHIAAAGATTGTGAGWHGPATQHTNTEE
jgi:MarR family transcriptional regulator for hemolysin